MAERIFFEEICDGILCEAAESFEDDTSCIKFRQFVDLRVLYCFNSKCVKNKYIIK